MNYLFHVLIFIWIFLRVNGANFDRYSGKEIEEAVSKNLRNKNATEACNIEIKPCTPHEGSRTDGTCNNFKQPSRGSAKGPYLRLLKPDYGNSSSSNVTNNIRQNKKGLPLPSARKVRTELQTTGRVDDKLTFTIAAPHFLEFIRRDVSALSGPRGYLRQRQNCCRPGGGADRRCEPIRVPENDPYLRVTDIRCLNFTRAETFQDAGCSSDIIPPEQINFQTPLLDLSTIYGVDEKALDSVRAYEHGLLKLEMRGELYVPLNISGLSTNVNDSAKNSTEPTTLPNEISMLTMDARNLTSSDICLQNKIDENVCYKFGFPEVGNYDLRTTTLAIFFMREHNRLAKELHRLNPCWKDDRLFKVARQINIATATNIFMYELLPLLLGYENMVHYGLISDRVEQLTAYYEDEVPLVYAEYEIATRYFHTLLDGRIKKYNDQYRLVEEISLSENLYRQSLLEQNKNFEEINRGMFYQRSAKIDDIQDPEISEKFFGDLQRAHDLAAIDIQMGRDLGVRGYNDYLHLCGMKPAKKFEDFADVMDMEKVLALKKLYDEVDDVDFLAGIMSENNIKGTSVGPTLFCIMAKQLLLWRFSDRFWFERGDQLHSLTLAQLHEVRRSNMARLACDNAEGIKHIQPRAFINVGHGNSPMPCNLIYGPDLTKWIDRSCNKQQFDNHVSHGIFDRKQKLDVKSGDDTGKKGERDDKSGQNDHNMVVDYSTFFDTLLSYKPQHTK